MMVLEKSRLAHRALLALLRAGLIASVVVVLVLPAAADVVLNEVLYDPLGLDDGEERIELYNNDGTPVDLTGHSLCVFPAYWDLPPITLMPGDYVVIRWNTSGTDGPSEFFTGPRFRTLGDSDGIGYYTSSVAEADYGNPANISDFIQWGGPGQGRSDVAQSAGIWTASEFIASVPEGMAAALSPDGGDQDGPEGWVPATPSFGGGNAVAVEQSTWGRIKELFTPLIELFPPRSLTNLTIFKPERTISAPAFLFGFPSRATSACMDGIALVTCDKCPLDRIDKILLVLQYAMRYRVQYGVSTGRCGKGVPRGNAMNTAHVLVVDDDLEVLASIRHVLSRHGYQSSAARNYQEAMKLHEIGNHPLAIVDMHLSGTDGEAGGLRVCEELKRRSPNTKCVVLSGFPDIEGAVRAIDIGAVAYLQKPVLPTKLVDAVQRALDGVQPPSLEAFREAVGKRLHLWRATKGLSLEQLGQRVSLSRSALSNIERGQTNLKLTVLLNISLALGIKPHEVLVEAERELGWLANDPERV